jgi:sulfate adenylyltransferase subunit 1 (EFTu-like GTPase family)
MVCWMTDQPLRPQTRLMVKHTTRTARAVVRDVRYRLDVNTLHREQAAPELRRNDIGRVTLRTTEPLFCDSYRRNRLTGSFVLIDEVTDQTVGAGVIN